MYSRTRALCTFLSLLVATPSGAQSAGALFEASIDDVQRAIAAGEVTARELVEQALARIEAYDKTGPAVNAVITINPRARERADELDARFRTAGLTGPLHGVPVIVKDNYDTHDMPTSAGSLSLIDSVPPDDAWQVRKLREAGAIVVAKSNMAEFAFSPYHTVGSALPGHTRNPYALNRVPAGSSGGTAAAVAASFGVVGLGTDTGNSIRGPSSHNALVGIRSTIGLTSRDGIVPLYLDHDVGGPMAKTVRDAAIVLTVIAGHDPADPITAAADAHRHGDYTQYLDENALDGARVGVLRQLADRKGADEQVLARFGAALDDLRDAGATVIDGLRLAELDGLVPPVEGEELPVWCPRFRSDLEAYLDTLGDAAPRRTLQDIVDSGAYHPSVAGALRDFLANPPPAENPDCDAAAAGRAQLTESVRALLTEHNLDALVYPTWSNPPRLIGDLNTPHGDNSQHVSPHTGFPAITVPMGYVYDGLPTGLQFVGDAWSEPRLIGLAYAYEQATGHRRPPASTPPLQDE
jgi:Asp-tRNA(Asn)/Glu-tRNA(Gln) amidotransferase A subunit family amidase